VDVRTACGRGDRCSASKRRWQIILRPENCQRARLAGVCVLLCCDSAAEVEVLSHANLSVQRGRKSSASVFVPVEKKVSSRVWIVNLRPRVRPLLQRKSAGVRQAKDHKDRNQIAAASGERGRGA
jgi:hypothetical protein